MGRAGRPDSLGRHRSRSPARRKEKHGGRAERARPGDRHELHARGQAGERHAFVWWKGKRASLGNLRGHNQSEPDALNNLGEILAETYGSRPRRAFLRRRGKLTSIAGIGTNAQRMSVLDLNNRAQVVGMSGPASGGDRPFRWQKGKVTPVIMLRRTFDGSLTAR
jgi:hypothetical protein